MLHREATISLDGVWDFAPGHLKCDDVAARLSGETTPWGEIDVPYFWNGSRWMSIVGDHYYHHGYYKDGLVPPYRDHRGVGWYRRRFTLPPEWRGRRIHLRFLAVAAMARVWVNGVEIGSHLGAYSAFTMDITDSVRGEAENLLVVQVWGKSCFYPDDQRTLDHGGIHLYVPGRCIATAVGETRDNAGIGQPVELFATGRAYLEDLQVRAAQDSLVLKLHLARKWSTASTLTVRVRLVEERTGLVAGEESRETRLPEERMVQTFVWGSLAVKAWSPETPNLYRLEARIEDGGAVLDQADLTIGFKTFTIKDGGFLLNGRPYFLRAAGPPASPLILNDREYIGKFLALCKSLNLNCLRFHTEPPSQAWLAGCDAAGLLVIFEGPLMQQAPEIVNTRAEYRALTRQAKHHPCLALYCLSNETEWLPFGTMAGYDSTAVYLQDLRQAVLEEDDSLPVYHNSGYSGESEGGDVRDWHFYGGWYQGVVYAYEALLQGRALVEALAPGEGRPLAPGGMVDRWGRKLARDPEKPLILTEFLAAYTAEDGHLLQYPLKVRRIGRTPDRDNRRSLWYQAFLLKESVEIMRRARGERNRLSGISPFALCNWFFQPLEKDGISPKPAAEALRQAMEPAHAGIRCWHRHVFGGDRLQAEVFLVNDDPARGDIPGGSLTFRLRGDGGLTVAEGRMPVAPLAYYGLATLELQLDVPPVAGSAITAGALEVEWRVGGEVLSRNAVDLLLAPAALREPFSPTGAVRRLHLHDPLGATAAVCERLGLSGGIIPGIPADPGPADLVVIGLDSLHGLTAAGKAGLNAAVKAGATVLVLEQDVYTPGRSDLLIDWIDGTPLRLIKEEDQVDDFVHLAEPEHPVFHGLAPDHFRFWNGNTVIISSYIRQGTEENHLPARTLFGSRAGYGVRKLANVRTLAEAYNFLRNDGLVEIALGRGKVILSQLEAVRRYGGDPVATVYLRNLFRYALAMAEKASPERDGGARQCPPASGSG